MAEQALRSLSEAVRELEDQVVELESKLEEKDREIGRLNEKGTRLLGLIKEHKVEHILQPKPAPVDPVAVARAELEPQLKRFATAIELPAGKTVSLHVQVADRLPLSFHVVGGTPLQPSWGEPPQPARILITVPYAGLLELLKGNLNPPELQVKKGWLELVPLAGSLKAERLTESPAAPVAEGSVAPTPATPAAQTTPAASAETADAVSLDDIFPAG